MASDVGSLIHDENLNNHHNASAGGKANILKAPRKGVLGARKPLGDLSNSVKPAPVHSLKKHNSSIPNKEISASKTISDGSKKKSLSRASVNIRTSNRKVLSDISNLGEPHLHEASKKNLNAKLSVAAKGHLSAIAEERFLHNHEKCIKAQMKVMDLDDFMRTIGLHNGFPKQSSPASDELKSASKHIDLEEIIEETQFADFRSPQKRKEFSYLDSPPPSSPGSTDHFMQWEDVNFKIKSPNFKMIESP